MTHDEQEAHERDELCRAVKAMPDHTPRKRIDAMRAIVLSHQAAKIGGVLVDVQSANAYRKVYDALSEERRERLEEVPLVRAVAFAWSCFK